MLRDLFEVLFSYSPVVFREATDFRFDLTASSLVAAVLVGGVVALAILTYKRVQVGEGRTRDRVILTGLRVVALALVLFCLFRPTLIVRAAVEQQNVLAVLFDDSRSMQIPDWNARARGAFVLEQFGEEGPIRQALSDRFQLRTFGFSASAARLESAESLAFGGTQTKLGVALEDVRDELAGLPVAGIVLVTDGADTGDDSLDDALLGLKADRIPVFPVGVGNESIPRDVQIDRVSTPRAVLKDASLLLDVIVRHTGFGGRTVTLDVEDEGRLVGSEQVTLPRDGSPASVRVRATAEETGPRMFTFRVAPIEGELVTQNNVRESLVDVRDRREQILLYQGEPHWEMKFLNRGVFDDENISVATLQRTADNKFMRLFRHEPDDPERLVGGFPQTREELFQYRGLILSRIEAGAFSGDQLQMIYDFVDRRGGGLLMLGGPRSFAEGGYGGTAVADVLPLLIEPGRRASEPAPLARLKVRPTREGQGHAVTQIADTQAASLERWDDLPLVSSVNEPLDAKPAASVLLTGTDEGGRDPRTVLASQRFGRGKAIALTLQETWPWQMHATVPLEDQTHEYFWRQLMRWLVEGVPEQVGVRLPDRVEPGEVVTIEASVVDGSFLELNDATVTAQVVRPSGATITVPLQWTGDRDGEYTGTFVGSETGAYEVNVDATASGGAPVGTGSAYMRAISGDAEFFDPTMHAAPLRRIAEETGGVFYTADTASGLAEDVRYAGRGVTTVEERELWNMPIILIALMTVVCAEWGYRRVVGLA